MPFPYRWKTVYNVTAHQLEEFISRYQADGWELFTILQDNAASFLLLFRVQSDPALVNTVNRDHTRGDNIRGNTGGRDSGAASTNGAAAVNHEEQQWSDVESKSPTASPIPATSKKKLKPMRS
jgi:hypothetical protein